jgi:hypothetical protein
MKLKQLFLAVTITLFAISCTKQDVFTPQPNAVKSEAVASTTSVTSTVSEPNLKAYVFIEPQSKYTMVSKYLKDSSQRSPSFARPFIGYWGVDAGALQHNFLYYVDMPHWYDGRLPAVIKTDIPQVSGGLDNFGNTKTAYNFNTFVIPKNTVVGNAWVNILIPVSAMDNDSKRQKKVSVYQKKGNVLVTNGMFTGTTHTMNNVIYSYVFNYQGNRIPKGYYRVYGTYPGTGFRISLNSTNDVYFRGTGN